MNGPAVWKRCGHGPGRLHPGDQVVVEAFRAYLQARKAAAPWAIGDDVAVGVGGGVERARIHPDHQQGAPDAEIVVLALLDPAGEQPVTLWLRCPRSAIVGAWNPAFAPLTRTGSAPS